MHFTMEPARGALSTSECMNLTLITCHPVAESFNQQLASAWARGAERAGASVQRFEVSALKFDPVLRGPNVTVADDEPDLARVRAAVESSAHVTWLFPTWWAGVPGAMKGLIDRLFLPDWSFRYEGGALPRGLLAGRSARWVTTMDSPRPWYALWHHDAIGGSLGNGTLRYVGFKPVERTVVYGARRLDEAARAKWVQRLEALGAQDAEAARRRGVVSGPLFA